MLGTDYPSTDYLPPDDGEGLLDAVAALLRDADLTFANLEGPLADSGRSAKCDATPRCYAFRTPTRYGRYLADAGIDLASLANNHALDFGTEGRRHTQRVLDSLGLQWSGAPGTFASLERQGRRLAMVAFHTARHSNFLNDHHAAAALVRRLATTHDIVLVSFHGGAEGSTAHRVPDGPEIFCNENRGDLRRFARAMIRAGADLILGHGPHVLRGLEVYRGRLIAYSLGNFATYGRFSLRGDLATGAILEAELAPDGQFLQGRLLATRQKGRGVPHPDPTGRALALVRDLSALDFPETGVVVLATGRLLARQPGPAPLYRLLKPIPRHLPTLPPTPPAAAALAHR